MKTDEEVIRSVLHEKKPIARLLDMLTGWAQYVEEEADAFPDTFVKREEIGALYQEAGAIALIDDPDAQDRAVKEFVEQHVIPMLLRRSSSEVTAGHLSAA